MHAYIFILYIYISKNYQYIKFRQFIANVKQDVILFIVYAKSICFNMFQLVN